MVNKVKGLMLCAYPYLLQSVGPGKPTFCSASFVSQADMNFPYVSMLLKNIQGTYIIDGVKIFAFNKMFPKECNFLPDVVGKHFFWLSIKC